MKLNDEMVYKAQAKNELTRTTSGTAVALIVAGIGLFLANMAGVHLLDIFAPLLFVGGLGVLMLMPAYKATAEQPTQWGFLAAPGAFFLTLGLLIFMMGLVDHFEGFAYAWALLPASVIAGLMYAKRFDEQHTIHQRGHRAIRFFLSAFMILGLFFELLVFESLGPWWPLILVGMGGYMVWQERQTN